MKYGLLFSFCLVLCCCTETATIDVAPEFLLNERGGIAQLKKDILYLASDELEGRDTGTRGEALAAEYIVNRMKGLGITAAGTDGYFQPFDFNASPELAESNVLRLDDQTLEPTAGYYPLNFSGNSVVKGTLIDCGFGIEAPDLGVDNYAGLAELNGQVALISVSSPDGIHPHSKYLEHNDLKKRAQLAIDKGADAVLFYKDDRTVQDPSAVLTENVNELDKTVLFLTSVPEKKSADVDLQFEIVREKKTGKNVVGFQDNGKEMTIVIGAHYDHLGHGISGSLHAGESAIHNGADDNASGVAAILQIAQDLAYKDLNHNVLYIGFSGEERGLLGSSHYAKNPTIDLEKVNYMINLDMVGRLDKEERIVGVNAIGTSPSWGFIDSLVVADLKTKTTQSGTGPSDHTSFYLQDIPAIHFFSGTHEDYHKPSDDEPLINYEGIEGIVSMIETIIYELEDDGELEFTQTKGEGRQAAAFKVTLGVIPDYLYEGEGMRIDGVTKGRPAFKSGFEKGDVVIKIASYDVGDIYAYMEALSKFEAGLTVEITVLRDDKPHKALLTFD